MWKWLIGGLVAMAVTSLTLAIGVGAEHEAGKFKNTELEYRTGLSDIWKITKQYVKADRKQPAPTQTLPVQPIQPESLLNNKRPAVYRLGHSSVLIQLDGQLILTDPVFSQRSSPVQWMGPKRFHPSPISIDDLPEINAVIISHDHYDHLDHDSIKKLNAKVEHFVTPLRVGKRLQQWGIAADKITELDWWQQIQLGTITFTATPSQHFSGRGLMDRDSTLWASWAIKGEQANLFFSGDSGYFSGFKQIGERLGPFDLTMIETGAYNKLWSAIHMLPEQSLQAHLDLKGKAMMPVHNATFDLALHDWYEPLQKITDLAEQNKVNLITPIFGEAVHIHEPNLTYAWWREVSDCEDCTQLSLASE